MCCVVLTEMMGDNIKVTLREIEDLHGVYSLAMHEVIRQVFVHCEDRGNLLTKIWKGLNSSYGNIKGLFEGKHSEYVEGLLRDLRLLRSDLDDRNDQLDVSGHNTQVEWLDAFRAAFGSIRKDFLLINIRAIVLLDEWWNDR